MNALATDILWTSVVAECRQKHIPHTIISQKALQDDLKQQEMILRRNNYTLAIPHTEVSKYFIMQTASCSFSHSRVVVTVKIPAIPLHEKPKLYSIRVLPFSHAGKVCHLNLENMNIISNEETVVRVQPEHCSSARN
jgi:hypothetical protein